MPLRYAADADDAAVICCHAVYAADYDVAAAVITSLYVTLLCARLRQRYFALLPSRELLPLCWFFPYAP